MRMVQEYWQEYSALVHRRKMLLRIAECSAILLGRAAAADSAGLWNTKSAVCVHAYVCLEFLGHATQCRTETGRCV
jgi:hypothetical protein